ncbi:MAG: hypothetical protein ACE5I2_10065, partial [Anaerolineae bacterium]
RTPRTAAKPRAERPGDSTLGRSVLPPWGSLLPGSTTVSSSQDSPTTYAHGTPARPGFRFRHTRDRPPSLTTSRPEPVPGDRRDLGPLPEAGVPPEAVFPNAAPSL